MSKTCICALLLIFLLPGTAAYAVPGGQTLPAKHTGGENGFIIAAVGDETWQPEEIQAINETATLLPAEYKALKPITLQKKGPANNSAGPLYHISFTGRTITILRRQLAKEQLQRVLVHALTRFLDREKHISETWEWRKLSRWCGWDILGNSSQNKNPLGFASPQGKKSPAEDLAAAAEMFFLPPAADDTMQYLKCRLPGKYRFFQSLFRSNPDPQGCITCKETYKDWIDPDEIEQIELIIASPSYVSLASIAGHILLLIRRQGDITGLSTVIGFVADSTNAQGQQDHGFTYVLKGIFGLYKSLLQEETLSSVIDRYTQQENRDLYRLKLNFTRTQLHRFIERLWEIKRTFNYRYYFFNLNCTTMMLNLIDDVLPPEEQIRDRDFMDLPLNIGSRVFCNGAADFVYPEYWSLSRAARYSSGRNREIAKQFVAYVRANFGREAAQTLHSYIEKVFSRTEENRAYYYDKIFSFYTDLHRQLQQNQGILPGGAVPGPGGAAGQDEKEFYLQGKNLLRFFVNARDREVYLRALEAAKKTGEIANPGEEQNISAAPEVAALLSLGFKLRYFLKPYLAEELNAMRREIRDEQTGRTLQERRKASYDCGYSQIQVSPQFFRLQPDRSSPGAAAGYSVFFQERGSGSVFSLGEDTHLELLSVGVRAASLQKAGAGRQGEGVTWDTNFTLIDFEKVMSSRNVDYRGWLNPGLGITLFERHSNRQEGVSQDVNLLNLRFILNIFEIERFTHFLDFSFGAGLSQRYYIDGREEHFMDFLFRLNGKFYLFGKRRNALRFNISYRPRFDFASGRIEEWRAGVDAQWGLGAHASTLLSLGMAAEQDRYHSALGNRPVVERIVFYTTLRFKGPFITKWIDFKKVLNKIF